MEYVVATTKDWNIKQYHKSVASFDGNWSLITSPEQLTLDFLKDLNPRYIFFPHWSWMVNKEITNRYECVCFHMTDLPYGRGGSPLQNLILKGHKNTLLTALKMTEVLDAGDIYKKVDLDLSGTAEDIYYRVAAKVFELICFIVNNGPRPSEQKGEVTHFKRRTPGESKVPENINLNQIYDYIRMLDAPTYPKAFINYGNFKMVFEKAKLSDNKVIANVVIKEHDNE